MLQHVWERASQTRYLTDLVIATDDDRIRSAAEDFGAKVILTRADHASGTDRVAEAASASNATIIVNIQGDEPMIDPFAIDAAVLGMLHDENIPMGTLKKRIERTHEITDPGVVKVVTDEIGNALYFSRSPIPYHRDAPIQPRPSGRGYSQPDQSRDQRERASDLDSTYFKHIGLYVYRREFLLAYPDLPVGPLEQAERLEQLRALENGFRIRVVETEYESLGVDTPADWQLVSELYERTFSDLAGKTKT
jgi:3-deoxy-manno-octulosonate cytidylyltransferase (CMP-KDO synthetase)